MEMAGWLLRNHNVKIPKAYKDIKMYEVNIDLSHRIVRYIEMENKFP
jgi:hypothetical protein